MGSNNKVNNGYENKGILKKEQLFSEEFNRPMWEQNLKVRGILTTAGKWMMPAIKNVCLEGSPYELKTEPSGFLSIRGSSQEKLLEKEFKLSKTGITKEKCLDKSRTGKQNQEISESTPLYTPPEQCNRSLYEVRIATLNYISF